MPEKINTVAAASFDFPEEVLLDLPIATIISNKSLTVQNFTGIREYSSESIKIKIKKGYIITEGQNLSVDEINREYIRLSGKIENVSYVLGDKDE